MRQRSVMRAGGDDGLVARTRGSELTHTDLEQIANLRLGEPVTEKGCHFLECSIGDGARTGHGLDLGRILPSALGFDETDDGHQVAGDGRRVLTV